MSKTKMGSIKYFTKKHATKHDLYVMIKCHTNLT